MQLRAARFEVLPDEYERVVADTAHTLATRGDLDDEQYARATAVLGDRRCSSADAGRLLLAAGVAATGVPGRGAVGGR